MKNKIIELLSKNIPDIDKEELGNLLEIPPKPDMGDYAFPCFRLAKTLAQFAEFFGDGRKAAVCREISKLHETTHRGTLGELRDYFTANEPKGEIVIVVQGADDRPKKDS